MSNKQIFADRLQSLLRSKGQSIGDVYTYWAEKLKMPRSTLHRWATEGLVKPDAKSQPYLAEIAKNFQLANINELWSEDSALYELNRILVNQTWKDSDYGKRWQSKVQLLRKAVCVLAKEMDRGFMSEAESTKWWKDFEAEYPGVFSGHYEPEPTEAELRHARIDDWLKLSDDEKRKRGMSKEVFDFLTNRNNESQTKLTGERDAIDHWLRLSDKDKRTRQIPQEVRRLLEKMKDEAEQRILDTKYARRGVKLEGLSIDKKKKKRR